MKQEFITTNGKVIMEDGVLHVKKLIHRTTSGSYFFAFWVTYAIFSLDHESKARPLLYVLVILLAIMILIYLAEFLFITSWKKKISMSDIRTYKLNKDASGLETDVILTLRSGRRKKITFRNLENQMDPFLEQVMKFITHPQYAH
jgi:hypothetical protein